MRRLIGIVLVTIVTIAAWTVFVAAGAREGWWRALPAAKGNTAGFLKWAEGRYADSSKGNFAMALLDRGRVAGSYFASHGRPVDAESLFQVASISKWVTAWGVMRLVEQGRINLDAPVSRYLTRWHLPPSSFDNERVTVRRLLSHTAGLTDGLGFLGYAPGDVVPTIEEELSHTRDLFPGAGGVIRVGAEPDSTWRYSGGGYLILQLLVEEVAHEPFNDFMRREVLQPLGMSASTFVDPDPAHLVDFYGSDGSTAIHYKFAALGAASLYMSLADMTCFVGAQLPGPEGALPGRGVLKPETLGAMRVPHAFVYGVPIWGLGETLYVPNGAGSYIIGHDGQNYPAINTTARFDPATGDGVIVLETGNATLAREIGGAWTFWHSGTVSLDTLSVFDTQGLLILLASGVLVILAGAVAIERYCRRRVA